MDSMRFKRDEAVRFWWEGRECTGIVEGHLHQFVLLRSNDSGHQWASMLAVKASQVWVPGDPPPVFQHTAVSRGIPKGFVDTEVTAS